MSVNKVILVGRLGQKPEVRSTPAGQQVANFSVATNESWTDKQGQKQEKTEWTKIVVWGKLAELAGQYLDKGRQVYLEGKLQTRQWQDKDGQTKYTTEVQAQTMQFLGDRGHQAESGSVPTGYDQPAHSHQAPAQRAAGGSVGRSSGPTAPPQQRPAAPMQPEFTEDDIPF